MRKCLLEVGRERRWEAGKRVYEEMSAGDGSVRRERGREGGREGKKGLRRCLLKLKDMERAFKSSHFLTCKYPLVPPQASSSSSSSSSSASTPSSSASPSSSSPPSSTPSSPLYASMTLLTLRQTARERGLKPGSRSKAALIELLIVSEVGREGGREGERKGGREGMLPPS